MINAWWRKLQGQDRTSILLFLGTLTVFIFTANRSLTFYANDTIFTAAPAWALGFAGSLNIDSFPDTGIKNWTFEYEGHTRSDRFPGAILFSLPFYAVARSSVFSAVPQAVAASVACALTVLILHRLLLQVVKPRAAVASALLFAFGTSVWSVASDAIWSEGPTMLGIALGTWLITKQSWALAGLGYAFAILSRPHSAVFAAVSGIWEGVTRRSIVPVIKVGLVSALGFAGLLLWNKVNSGQWDIFPASYGGRIEGATNIGVGGQATGREWLSDYAATFFSPLRGLFVYSPFLLLLLPGLFRAWRVAPSWVRSTAVGGVLYLVIQLAGNSWFGGGGFFGYRLIIPSLFAWWPLLTLAWEQWTVKHAWSRITFYALAAVSVWWFAIGSLTFRSKYFDANPLEFLEWQNWTAGLYIGWAGPFGWAAAAVFVGLLGFLVSLVPDEDPDAQPTKKGKTKQNGTGKAVNADTATAAEPVAAGAKSKNKPANGGDSAANAASPGAKKKPAPNANKKRR